MAHKITIELSLCVCILVPLLVSSLVGATDENLSINSAPNPFDQNHLENLKDKLFEAQTKLNEALNLMGFVAQELSRKEQQQTTNQQQQQHPLQSVANVSPSSPQEHQAPHAVADASPVIHPDHLTIESDTDVDDDRLHPLQSIDESDQLAADKSSLDREHYYSDDISPQQQQQQQQQSQNPVGLVENGLEHSEQHTPQPVPEVEIVGRPHETDGYPPKVVVHEPEAHQAHETHPSIDLHQLELHPGDNHDRQQEQHHTDDKPTDLPVLHDEIVMATTPAPHTTPGGMPAPSSTLGPEVVHLEPSQSIAFISEQHADEDHHHHEEQHPPALHEPALMQQDDYHHDTVINDNHPAQMFADEPHPVESDPKLAPADNPKVGLESPANIDESLTSKYLGNSGLADTMRTAGRALETVYQWPSKWRSGEPSTSEIKSPQIEPQPRELQPTTEPAHVLQSKEHPGDHAPLMNAAHFESQGSALPVNLHPEEESVHGELAHAHGDNKMALPSQQVNIPASISHAAATLPPPSIPVPLHEDQHIVEHHEDPKITVPPSELMNHEKDLPKEADKSLFAIKDQTVEHTPEPDLSPKKLGTADASPVPETTSLPTVKDELEEKMQKRKQLPSRDASNYGVPMGHSPDSGKNGFSFSMPQTMKDGKQYLQGTVNGARNAVDNYLPQDRSPFGVDKASSYLPQDRPSMSNVMDKASSYLPQDRPSMTSVMDKASSYVPQNGPSMAPLVDKAASYLPQDRPSMGAFADKVSAYMPQLSQPDHADYHQQQPVAQFDDPHHQQSHHHFDDHQQQSMSNQPQHHFDQQQHHLDHQYPPESSLQHQSQHYDAQPSYGQQQSQAMSFHQTHQEPVFNGMNSGQPPVAYPPPAPHGHRHRLSLHRGRRQDYNARKRQDEMRREMYNSMLNQRRSNQQQVGANMFQNNGLMSSRKQGWLRRNSLVDGVVRKFNTKVVPKINMAVHESRLAAEMLREGYINARQRADSRLSRRNSPMAMYQQQQQQQQQQSNQHSWSPFGGGRQSLFSDAMSRTLPDMIGKEAPIPNHGVPGNVVHNSIRQTSHWQTPNGEQHSDVAHARTESHALDPNGGVVMQRRKTSTSSSSSSTTQTNHNHSI